MLWKAFFIPMFLKGEGAKLFAMMLFVFCFFISGYEHSIANICTFAIALSRPSRYSNIDGSCQKPDSRDARKSNGGRRHDEIVISFSKCRQIKKLPEIRLSASSGGSYSEIF